MDFIAGAGTRDRCAGDGKNHRKWVRDEYRRIWQIAPDRCGAIWQIDMGLSKCGALSLRGGCIIGGQSNEGLSNSPLFNFCRFRVDTPTGGLEVPCVLVFVGK